MWNILASIYNINFLEETASKKSIIHGLDPLVKLLVTIVYSFLILSFNKYEITALLPLAFYPVVLIILSDVPIVPLLKRLLIVLPLVVSIGILNPLINKNPFCEFLGITISYGWISFFSLVIRLCLTVLAGLLLIATTGIEKISAALRRIRFPKMLTIQLMLTYRYISVLLEEVGSVVKAYHLRAPGEKGISLRTSGSLIGQLLLRSFERADRLYSAMLLRGFSGEYNFGKERKIDKVSGIYLITWSVFFLIARFLNIPEILGQITMGVLR